MDGLADTTSKSGRGSEDNTSVTGWKDGVSLLRACEMTYVPEVREGAGFASLSMTGESNGDRRICISDPSMTSARNEDDSPLGACARR